MGVGGPGREGNDGGELQGSEEDRREEGEAAAEKEMDEGGEKWTTRCLFAEWLRPEEEGSWVDGQRKPGEALHRRWEDMNLLCVVNRAGGGGVPLQLRGRGTGNE